MKRVFFALGFFFCFIKLSSQVQLSYKLSSKEFDIKIPNLKQGNYGFGEIETVSGAVLYKVGKTEHIIQNSADSLSPALHFIKDSTGNWVFENYYDVASVTGGFRNYVFVDTLGTIAFASTGSESIQPWLHGDLLLCKTIGTKLQWTRISNKKSFYHAIGIGDLNGDGLYDALGVHMGTKSDWGEEPHIYTQNNDSTFSETRGFLDVSQYKGMYNGLGSIYVGNLLGNKYPEIILGEYGFNPVFGRMSNRLGFGLFTYDVNLKKYIYLSSPSKLGVFSDSTHGSTSIKAADFNNDGINDLAIATEGLGGNKVQIWIGDGKGNFTPGQILNYPEVPFTNYPDSSNTFREFEVMDFDGDGWQDIVVHPFHYGNLFRINPKENNWNGSGISLQGSIWRNNKGVFNKLINKIQLDGIKPGFMKGFMIDGNLRFFGFQSKYSPSTPDRIALYDVTVSICNNLIKPTFNTTKFSFCSGDSLKLTVTNINKGDSLKWYYGSKADLTNVSNKIFTDSTKLFVTRTDSLGCVISSDTVSLVKYAIPSAPTLSRDTASYLVPNVTKGITWYKDGTVLSDTTLKIKPTTTGSYTGKTTQNGCISSASSSYYYIVTDLINLSSDEFIKLAPNPFTNQLNFDFVVKGYQRLNLEVFDMATGTKVASKQNQTAGIPIYLGQLAAGTYVIKVSSNDNKIAYQFKMVKL